MKLLSTFRVLPVGDVAGVLGYLLPVRSQRSQTIRPFRYSCHQPRPRMRLRKRSSHGVQRSSTVYPESPRLPSLDVRHLSWGFVPLQRIRGESPRPGCPGSASGSHPTGYGAAHRFSQPLSDLFLSPPSHHFSGRWRSWGSPYRGLTLSRSPGDSSSPAYPLDVAPTGLEPPILGRGIHG